MSQPSVFPSAPVRIVDPFGAGGGPDLIGRALARTLADRWGRVTVENRPGAGSTRGAAVVAEAPPDGHTLLIHTSAHAYRAAIPDGLPYHPSDDFIPIAPVTRQAYVLIAGAPSGFVSLEGLVTSAHERLAPLRFGSTGVATGSHVGVVALNRRLGIDAVHVPTEEDAAIADAIGRSVSGGTDYQLAPIEIATPLIRQGRLAALGVSTAERSRLLPDVPSLAEAGASGFDFPIWYGIWAPAGTPPGIVEVIARDITRALADQDLRALLLAHGGEPMTMTQGEFARFVLDETATARRVLGLTDVPPASSPEGHPPVGREGRPG